MVNTSGGRPPLHQTQMKLVNAIAAASATASILLGAPMIEAKADYTSCNSFGDMTSCYGSNGSTYNSYGISDSYRSFSGTDSHGNFYSGSCMSIGDYTSCTSY